MSERESYHALPAGEPHTESDDILISEAPSKYVPFSLSAPKPDLDHQIAEVTYPYNPQDTLISFKPTSPPEPNPISNLLNRGFSLEQLHPFIKNQPPVSEELVLEERTLYSLSPTNEAVNEPNKPAQSDYDIPSFSIQAENEQELEHQIIERAYSASNNSKKN